MIWEYSIFAKVTESVLSLESKSNIFVTDWLTAIKAWIHIAWIIQYGCGLKESGFKIFFIFLSWSRHGTIVGYLGRWKGRWIHITWNENITYKPISYCSQYMNSGFWCILGYINDDVYSGIWCILNLYVLTIYQPFTRSTRSFFNKPRVFRGSTSRM